MMGLAPRPASAQQEPDLLQLAEDGKKKPKEYVSYAFKSSRVIMQHSIEMIPEGTLDFRILHRFAPLNLGLRELFGLDAASIRLGLDYGVKPWFTVGLGRSGFKKELDGFAKFRLLRQTRGSGSPVTLMLASGFVVNTLKWPEGDRRGEFRARQAYYNQLTIGRKFSDAFTLQLSPLHVHRNIVENLGDDNELFSLGTGARLKLSKRVSLNVDYFYNFNGQGLANRNPLSLGFDIETGGHVFQLHFSNATGMNERAFIAETTGDWGDGGIRFGFNISRSFTVKRPKR